MSRDSRVRDRRRNDRDARRREARQRERKQRRKQEKGRNGCASCLIRIVVLIVITLGALYGGGFFAWKQYVQPKVGVSFNDALALVGSTYIAKDKDIVTNGFEEKDLDGFYDGLSDALFLSDNVDLKTSLADVLEGFVVSMTKSDSSSTGDTESSGGEISTEEEGASTVTTTEPKTTTGNEALDKFLKELEFDFSRLKDYEDEYATPQILTITDKQTAAFLDNTIDLALGSEEIKTKLPELVQNVTLKDIVDIPQVIVSTEEINGLKQIALTLTVRINLRTTVKEVASAVHPALQAAAYVLPKKLYATMTIYPNDYMKGAKIKVNSFSDKKMNDVYSIANYFLASTSYGSIDGMLQMVNQKAVEAIEKVQSIVPVEFLETGSVNMSPIKALMNVLGAKELTETQFFCMVRDLCLPTFDDVKEHLGFASTLTEEQLDTYLQTSKGAVAQEISAKYGLQQGYLTADNMLDKLKGVGGEKSELVNNVSLASLDYSDESYNATNAKVHLDYIGLASLLSGYLNSSTSESTGSLKFEVINSLYDKDTETLSLVLRIGVLAAMQEKLGSGSIFAGFLGQIIPKDIFVKANVCLATDDTSLATIEINNRDVAGTEELLSTINGLTSSMGTSLGLDQASLGDKIANGLRDGIKNLNTQLGTALVFEDSMAYLPSIYEIMSSKILYSAEVDADNLSPAEVYRVFKGACVVDNKISGVNKTNDLTSFTNVVNTRYSITNEEDQISATSEVKIVDQLKAFGSVDSVTGKAKYDTAIDGVDLSSRWNTSTTVDETQRMHDEFNPYALEDEAANIFDGAFKVTASGVKNITLNKVIVENEDKLTLVYSCEYETNEETKYANALPHFVINVLLDKTKISSTTEACVTVTINTMTDEVLQDFALVCTRLGITSFNMDSIRTNTDESVKNGLKDLFEKIEVTFDADNDAIYFGSIFEIAYKMKHTDIETGFAAESFADPSALDVAHTIAALHVPVEAYGAQSSSYVPFNTASVDTSELGHVKANLEAKNLGHSVAQKAATIDNIGLKTGYTPSVLQTMLVDLSTTQNVEIDEVIVDLNALYKASLSNMYGSSTDNYIAVTFAIEKAALKYETNLMPANLYLSLALENEYNGDILLSYNNLTKREVTLLKALAGSANAEAFDIYSTEPTGIKAKMKANIYDVTLFTYNAMPVKVETVLLQKNTRPSAATIVETLDDTTINGEYRIDIIA